jgi:hypothetical protein
MLDVDFLRSLRIKEDLHPAPRPHGTITNEKESSSDLPQAGEFMVPPEIWDLGEEELKRLIMNEYRQDKPYKCVMPQGHVIAIYPHSGEGRYDLEFTVEELVVLKNLMRDLGSKLTAYQDKSGSWVNWKWAGHNGAGVCRALLAHNPKMQELNPQPDLADLLISNKVPCWKSLVNNRSWLREKLRLTSEIIMYHEGRATEPDFPLVGIMS